MHRLRQALACLAAGVSAATWSTADEPATPSPVPRIELRQNDQGRWRFFVGGAEFAVRGVGGAEEPGLLEKLHEAGGNCVRTWGIESLEVKVTDGKRFIDRAHELGIMVIPGIWIQHERHGFNYSNPAFIAGQREKVLANIRAYKDHPAVLAWGLGNEMEGPIDREGSIAVFKELEQLARLVKAEDPDHPIMTVIAFQPEKVKNVIKYAPGIDILGANSYGGAAGVGGAMKGAGWEKPFIVAEFGISGFWEVGKTPWGAPFEPTSHEKGRMFYSSHRMVHDINDNKERCLGTFAFLWGWKQECTPTWFGMFLPTLDKLGPVDAMTKVWTGAWPSNRCPRIESLTSPAYGKVVQPSTALTATATVEDPEGDTLAYEWTVISESTGGGIGGEAESALDTHPELVREGSGPSCTFDSPATLGNYRLYLTVRDGRGSAATANFPFRVEP